jgi:hypothetical protein
MAKGQFATKFSDLNAYSQFLQARFALIIATTALTATGTAIVIGQFPARLLPEGAIHFPLYVSPLIFAQAVIWATRGSNIPEILSGRIVGRLASRELSSPDEVEEPLQEMIINNIISREGNCLPPAVICAPAFRLSLITPKLYLPSL